MDAVRVPLVRVEVSVVRALRQKCPVLIAANKTTYRGCNRERVANAIVAIRRQVIVKNSPVKLGRGGRGEDRCKDRRGMLSPYIVIRLAGVPRLCLYRL